MADALERTGRPAAATAELRASREILAGLVAADPANAQLAAELEAVDDRLAAVSEPG